MQTGSVRTGKYRARYAFVATHSSVNTDNTVRWEYLFGTIFPRSCKEHDIGRALGQGHKCGIEGRAETLRQMFPSRQIPKSKLMQGEHLRLLDHLRTFKDTLKIAVEAVPEKKYWNAKTESGSRVTNITDAAILTHMPYYWNRCTTYCVPARGDPYGRLIMDFSMKNMYDDLDKFGTNSRIEDETAATRLIPGMRVLLNTARETFRLAKRLEQKYERRFRVKMWSIDIKKFFLNFLASPEDRRQLAFAITGEDGTEHTYMALAMVFGLRTSPKISCTYSS